jgi:hypothetical protein
MCYATFNIVSVIYHICAIGKGIQETHVFATFNNVSVIYHSINVGRGWGLMFNASYK